MNKQKDIFIPLLAFGIVFLLGYKGFGWDNSLKNAEVISTIVTLSATDSPKREAWTTFENYLEFARTHNLSGIRSLSHQISSACNDSLREEECFALMDNVYTVASRLELSEFKHIQMDKRQIIMFTDGPVVAILYFTRDVNGTPKMLGLRFCLEDETKKENCVETEPGRRDLDSNGWWDSVESLFYQ